MKKKIFGRFASVLLAVAMVLAMSVTAFAATTPAVYSNQAHITVGKTLTAKQAGVWPDTTTFTFKLAAESYTAGPDAAGAGYTAYTKANMPMPAAGTANTAATLTDGALTETITVSGFNRNSTAATQSLSVVTGNATYTQTGVYTYKLTEVIPADADKEPGVTYDDSVYYVNVYVTNVLKEDGTPLLYTTADQTANPAHVAGQPVLNVSNITAFKGTNGSTDPMAQDFNGIGAGNSDTDAKVAIVTPTDGNPRNITYPFTNNYSTSDFVVTKKVTGTMADVNKQFGFTIDLKNSHNTADTRSYSYQVWNMGADETKGGTDDTMVTATGKSGTLTNGGTFTLKHDEYIVITGLADGERITVTENGAADYKTTIKTQNGTAAATTDITDAVTNKTAGEKILSTADGAINRQDFVNNKESVTPTGITLESLPFVIIAAAAGAALIFMLRKRRDGVR